MKTHTSQFKENISLIGKQLDSKITYELNGVVQTLTSEQLNSITPTFQGAILKSVMKELDLDSNVDIPLGTIINYKFGVLVDNAYEYLDFGNYIVYSSEKQEDTNSYKIICYDKMLNSMKKNEDLGITYPLNVRDYINALCTKIGLEFKNKNDEFANFDRILDKELYVGLDYTYRDILDELAQVTASTIGLNLDDKVEIKYPKVVGETKIKSGTNIQIKEDSNISLTSMKLDGKSTQETSTDPVRPSPDYPSEIEVVKANNLLPNNATSQIKNGITFAVNDDKTINANGVATAYADLYMIGSASEYVDLGVPTGNYILSGCPAGGSGKSYMLYVVKKNGDKLFYYQEFGNGLTISINPGDKFRIFIRILTGTEVSNILYKPMLSKFGGNYVPYGNIQIVETGKNLFNKDDSDMFLKNLAPDNAGKVIAATTNIMSSNFVSSLIIKCESNTTYTIQKKASKTFYLYDSEEVPKKDSTLRVITVQNPTTNKFTFTTDKTAKYIICKFYNTWVEELYSYDEIVSSIQVEKGSTATDYEPYIEEVENIDLKENELYSLPNGVKDELILKDGKTKIIKKIGKIILDGVHNVFDYKHSTLSSDNKGFYRFKLPGKSISYPSGEVGTALSNYFVEVSGAAHIAFNNNSSGLWWEGRTEYAYMILEKTLLVEANKWLSTHNTIVYYELETPKEIDLEQTVDIKTYKKLTNISNSEDANMEISYISPEVIDEEMLKDINVNFGEKFGPINSIVLSRSAESDNVYLQNEESIAQNGLCEIKIKDNQIMNWNDRSDYLPDILEKLDGLEYYLNDFSSTGIAYLDLCDRYNIKVFDSTYPCIMFNDEMKVTQGLEENVHTDMPEETETDYTKADKTDRKINNVSLIVDKQQQEITALAEKVQDISRTVTGTRSITLEDCNKTPLYKLVITGDDSKLFPNSKLFPSQTTFTKNSHLVVNKDTQNEKFYDLKIPALRTLGDVKDEYIMEDYNATYIKRVGINDNLEKYVLDKPIETDLGQIIVELEEGTNTLTMPSFPTNTYTATYLVKNQYTDTFASTAYVDSQIKISTDNILLESKSYTDKSTEGDELISKINLDSTGAVKIDASKTLDLTGSVINMTADDVRIKSNRLDIEPEGTITLIDDGARNPNNPSASYIINSSWLETVSETEYNKLDATHKITSVSRDFHYETKNTISSSTGYGTYDGKILETLYKYPSTIWEYGNAEVGYENTSVSYSGITTPQLTQTSLAEKKKNFSKYEGALEEIKKIDIYKYNLKFESDDTKKHLGFVIGEGYNYSEVITDNKNEGVDNYSMTSLCLQAIKEQQKIIEDLQKKINSIIMDKESDK